MKRFKVLPVVLLVLLLLAACNANHVTNKAPNAKFYKITDASGKQVKLSKRPKKIISLMPSNTEILFALGLGKEVKGVSSSDDYPAATKKIPKVVTTEIDTEKIIAMKPDLVLGHASSLATQKDAYNQLKEAKVPVFIVKDAQTLQDTEKTIKQIGKLTGTAAKATKLVKHMEKEKADLQKQVKKQQQRPKVWIEISSDLYTAGKKTFMNEMLELAGGKNIVSQSGYPKYSEEAIIKANPDVIITTYPNAKKVISKRSAWKNIQAVKKGHIYELDADKLSRPGPRLIDGAKEIYRTIYQ